MRFKTTPCEGGTLQIDTFVQNAENDDDFTVATPDGVRDLELTELAPLRGPYESAATRRTHGEAADMIVDAVMKKAAKRPAATTTPLVLLVYVTHFAFNPSPTAIRLACHYLGSKPHPFERVFLFCPTPGERGLDGDRLAALPV